MYYFNKTSRKQIIHDEQCHHLRGKSKEDLGCFESVKSAYDAGYRFCKCCSPLAKKYRAEEKAVLDYCSHNGLSLYLHNKAITIWTPRSQWKIVIAENKNKTTLYHKNEFNPVKDPESYVPGYHPQHVCHESIREYLDYIIEHDYFRMLNPIYAHAKKEPPQKGTKRWRKAQKQEKKKARRASIHNVLNIIESLQDSSHVSQAM